MDVTREIALPVLRTSPAAAFVVHLALDPAEDLLGRVEHVVSGCAARFASPQELLAFMRRVLEEAHGSPAASAARGHSRGGSGIPASGGADQMRTDRASRKT